MGSLHSILPAGTRSTKDKGRSRRIGGSRGGGDGDSPFILDQYDKPRPILANAIAAVSAALGERLFHNEFLLAAMLSGAPPWAPDRGRRDDPPRELTDADDIGCADWLQREHSIYVGPEIAAQALQHVAQQRTVHPVRDYLDGLRWDRKPRLATWLTYFLGTPDAPYVRAVAEKWMVSAVARVYQPGCKADCALILEGRQGLLKSSALAVLGGDWFTDEIDDLGSKDAALQCRGVWIVEMAELTSLQRTSVEKVKAFMARKTDRFRPPYGRRLITSPRQCVFAGTVNDAAYLRDDTGGRRFWPVECVAIDLEALKDARNQLWAEAVVRFKAKATWWLDDADIIAAAEVEQDARFLEDAWENEVSRYLFGCGETTVGQVLEHALLIPKGQWTRAHEMRVASIFKRLGWIKVRGNKGGVRYSCYRPLQGGESQRSQPHDEVMT